MSTLPLMARCANPTHSSLLIESFGMLECTPSRRLTSWGKNESERLFSTMEKSRTLTRSGKVDWAYVAMAFPHRTKRDCFMRWRRKQGILERERRGVISRPKCLICGSGKKFHSCAPTVKAVEVPADSEKYDVLEELETLGDLDEPSGVILDDWLVWKPATHLQIDTEIEAMSWSKNYTQRNQCGL